jgi:7-keto-8-aminopelargonate synthetase-like enzyme/predicted N-acyltransferase
MIKKTTSKSIIDTINDIVNTGREKGLGHLYTEDETYNGRTIKINGKDLINFASCSYLGLDIDPRIKEAAIDAIRRYGVQFSCSRSFIACTLYTEWEKLIGQMFNAPIVLSTSVSLGHHAVIPIVVEEGDVIIMDQQVHASVQDAALKMQSKGVLITVVRHNRLDELEEKFFALCSKHGKIWYMIDGVYSMYGDYAPMKDLIRLANKHKQLHIYADDAHGMSIAGINGTGVILSQVELHEKMILATSLNKAFAAGGGAFIFPNKELCQKVRNCGGAMMFSGPHQIPVIGAGIASAKIHLSPEIYQLQSVLKEKVNYCHNLLKKHRLPLISNPNSPISFIGLGLTRVGSNMVKRMIEDGFFVNLGIFPAVPETCTGMRFTITNHHTLEDIEKLTSKIAYHLPQSLKDEDRTIEDIHRAFRKVYNFEKEITTSPAYSKSVSPYKIQHETSILKIKEDTWNSLLGVSSFDWNMLLFLEEIFKNNSEPENNWDFHYYIILDKDDKPVLATFFTLALTKEDMLSPITISQKIESERIVNPYYLSSLSFVMGSLLTDGQHLYIDRSRPDWKNIMMLLLDRLWKEQERLNANSLSLRDFDAQDHELNRFFSDQGFVKINLPDRHCLKIPGFANTESYLKTIKADKRYYVKRKILKNSPHFRIKIVNAALNEESAYYYQLYKNVTAKSFELNTFHLPEKLFKNLFKNPQWEIIELKLNSVEKPVGIALCYKTTTNYNFVLSGMDYKYLEQGIYPQILWQILLRAKQLNLTNINLGLTASQNKRKLGARSIPQVGFVQMQDKFGMSVINSIANSGFIPNHKSKT